MDWGFNFAKSKQNYCTFTRYGEWSNLIKHFISLSENNLFQILKINVVNRVEGRKYISLPNKQQQYVNNYNGVSSYFTSNKHSPTIVWTKFNFNSAFTSRSFLCLLPSLLLRIMKVVAKVLSNLMTVSNETLLAHHNNKEMERRTSDLLSHGFEIENATSHMDY